MDWKKCRMDSEETITIGKDNKMMNMRKTDVRKEERMADVLRERWMTKGSVECVAKR